MDDLSEEKLKKALLKKALGYVAKEQVCEYSVDENGEEVLSKKKVTKKFNPPDINAVKFLMEQKGLFSDEKLSHMTLSELKKEKKRLLKLLKEEQNED